MLAVGGYKSPLWLLLMYTSKEKWLPLVFDLISDLVLIEMSNSEVRVQYNFPRNVSILLIIKCKLSLCVSLDLCFVHAPDVLSSKHSIFEFTVLPPPCFFRLT